MRTYKTQRVFAIVIIAVLACTVAISVYASVTGNASVTDHDITLNSYANGNKIQCERTLKATSLYVKGTNNMTWYTFTGTPAELAYCNAIRGTSTVRVTGLASDFSSMTPRSTTVDILGQNLSTGINCSATRNHNLDLVLAETLATVIIKTPDGDVMTTYQKTISIS